MKKAITLEQAIKELYSPQEIADIESKVALEIALRRLKSTRKKKGLTQEQVAEKARLPRSTISKIETGFQNVSLFKIMQFANALGKDIEICLVDKKEPVSS